MKVSVFKDERYPDYGIDRKPYNGALTVEISDELLAEIDAAELAYAKIQIKLADLYELQS